MASTIAATAAEDQTDTCKTKGGKEVVITDSKSDRSNDDAELPRITFTYQYAQRNHNVLQLYREGRIFDNTFDDTCN